MKKVLAVLIVFVVAAAFTLKAYSSSLNTVSQEGNTGGEIETNIQPQTDKVLIDVPAISQLPELPRGCEVTALTMLLNYAGAKVNKMELADKIRKVQYQYNGLKGNPQEGFVGNIFNGNDPGYGVYNKPIVELANQYLPGRIVDLTGVNFNAVLYYLDKGHPVWVINNKLYDVLSNDQWITWNTTSGKIRITYKEHSVLVTGYDSKNIYFNDPLTGQKNIPIPRDRFIEAWKQIGSMAVTYSY
jgi:Uncharacterized protein conserved in bacteria